MEYVLLRYRDEPTDLTAVWATADPGTAVAVLQRWRRAYPNEGLIAAIGATAVVHCLPRPVARAADRRITRTAGP